MVILIAFIMGIIDSSLGMMYGTLTVPLLILLGIQAKTAIPAVILSQALCDLTATIVHQKNKNGNFSSIKTRDTKLVLAITIPGILAIIFGVFLAVKIPAIILNTYIGALVTLMGLLCIFPVSYNFAWWKIYCIGIISSFNKAISGGGFGPVTVTGKILSGVDSKVSIATTILSKGVICFLSFILWIYVNRGFDYKLAALLSAGAVCGATIGPYITRKTAALRVISGIAAILTGLLVIAFKMKA